MSPEEVSHESEEHRLGRWLTNVGLGVVAVGVALEGVDMLSDATVSTEEVVTYGLGATLLGVVLRGIDKLRN
jgi:hypothetical protein